MPGLKRHFITHSIAFSSRPRPRDRTTFNSCGRPLSSTISESTTVPFHFALRASSEYSGSTLRRTDGAETQPPIRYTPLRNPPPLEVGAGAVSDAESGVGGRTEFGISGGTETPRI